MFNCNTESMWFLERFVIEEQEEDKEGPLISSLVSYFDSFI